MRVNSSIKVGLVQQTVGAEKATNMQKLVANIRECVQKGAQLVVLQELHNTPYFCQVEDVANFDLAESIPGESTALYSSVAKE